MIRPTLALLSVACLPSIEDTLDPGPPVDTDPPVAITTTVPTPSSGDTGQPPVPLVVASFVVDATDHDVWVGVDLEVFDASVDPEGDAWDLRFRRFEVALNGGVSGPGGVEVALLDDDFDDVTSVPEDAAWVTDSDDDDGDDKPEYALESWYLYDEATHLLDPAPGTWLVHAPAPSGVGTTFRFEFTSYYDDAGTPARVGVRVGPLPEERP